MRAHPQLAKHSEPKVPPTISRCKLRDFLSNPTYYCIPNHFEVIAVLPVGSVYWTASISCIILTLPVERLRRPYSSPQKAKILYYFVAGATLITLPTVNFNSYQTVWISATLVVWSIDRTNLYSRLNCSKNHCE